MYSMKVLYVLLIIIFSLILIPANVNAQNKTIQESIYSEMKHNSSMTQSPFNNRTVIDVDILHTEPPFEQFKSGVAVKNISCNIGLVLILKAEDNSPSCVHTNSAANLLILGWAIPIEISNDSVIVTGSNDVVHYNIVGGKLLGVVSITHGKEIHLILDSTGDGIINMTLPQSVINTDLQDKNDSFFISSSNYGRITSFNKTDILHGTTLVFQFKHGDSKIQIADLSWLEKMDREYLRPET